MVRKEIVQYLEEGVEKLLPMKIVSYSKVKRLGRPVFFLENDCKIECTFDIVRNMQKGKYAYIISFSMVLHNPFLSKVLRESFHKRNDNPLTKDIIVSLDYLHSLPKVWNVYLRYSFDTDESRKITADRLLQDINDYFIPYCSFLTADYGKVLEYYSNPEFIKNIDRNKQFVLGVVCSLLGHQESKIEEVLVPLAEQSTNPFDFADFKAATDYYRELVLPIKEYIAALKV